MRYKEYLLLFFSIGLCLSKAVAQDTTVLATVKYEMTYRIDTTMPESPLKQEMILLLGKETSLYRSKNDITADIRMKAFFAKNNFRAEDSKMTHFFGETSATFKLLNEKKILNYTLLGGVNYHVQEVLPTFKWEIKAEQKNIGGYICQKAITNFKGRLYQVWFTSQIPYSNGPWKFGGLPGLILEASDSEGHWVIRFVSFEQGGQSIPAGVRIPDLGYTVKKIEQNNLSKIVQAYRTDPNGFLGISTGSGALVASSASANKPTKQRTFNNPLERKD